MAYVHPLHKYITLSPGKGDGTFKHPRTFGIEPGLAPQDVAVGDLNGDLHADIITANALSNDITVLRGKYNARRWLVDKGDFLLSR